MSVGGGLLLGRVPPAVRLAGFVVPVTVEVAAAGGRARGVQVLAATRRLRRVGRDRILRRQREQRFRGLGRVTDAAVMMMVMMLSVAVVMTAVVGVLVMVVMMMMMVAVVFLAAALDVFQLQIHHVLLSATATAPATDAVGDLIAVQVLVPEPVAAERLGGQVVPRLDRLDGAVIASVRGRRLRLDRVLPRVGRMVRLLRDRLVVPVQRVRAQRRGVRRRAVLGQAVLVSGRRALTYALVRGVPVVHQVRVTVVTTARRLRRQRFVPRVTAVPHRIAPFLVSLPAV